MISVYKMYSALSSSQKEFIKNPKKTFIMMPGQFLKFVRPIAELDKDADSVRKFFGGLAVACFIIFVLLMIYMGNTSADVVIPVVVDIVFALIFTVFWFVLRGIDMHNNLRIFTVPVINAICMDMEPTEKFKLLLDLRDSMHASKLDRSPHLNRLSAGTITYFRDNWFTLTAKLSDGSTIDLKCSDLIRKKHVVKRSASGKRKSKTKYKIKRKMTAIVSLRKKQYDFQPASSLQSSSTRLKTKDNDKKNVISLSKTTVDSTVAHIAEPEAAISLVGKILMSVKAAGKGA